MPFLMVREDITRMETDAIVSSASPDLSGGGGADAAIRHAAGEGLLAECSRIGSCAVGEAKLTGGYQLQSRYVIHTVCPVWTDEKAAAALRSCYRAALSLAKAQGCESIAFPLLGAGACGCPTKTAMAIAMDEIARFLEDAEMLVYLVVFDQEAHCRGRERFPDLCAYIRDHEVVKTQQLFARGVPLASRDIPVIAEAAAAAPAMVKKSKKPSGMLRKTYHAETAECDPDLLQKLHAKDESFSEMLLRLIDERGMTDAQVYKKANIDRRLFSKIRSDAGYQPKKQTVLAFAIALELELPETEKLLRRAGFVLSDSLQFDLIVKYFIERHRFNIFEINEALFAFDQVLIGSTGA